jgi:hypothetical protein
MAERNLRTGIQTGRAPEALTKKPIDNRHPHERLTGRAPEALQEEARLKANEQLQPATYATSAYSENEEITGRAAPYQRPLNEILPEPVPKPHVPEPEPVGDLTVAEMQDPDIQLLETFPDDDLQEIAEMRGVNVVGLSRSQTIRRMKEAGIRAENL